MTGLYIAFQRLLPKVLLGRLVHWLSRRQTPWLKDALIRGFVRLYEVDLAEAARPAPTGYASFNEFFTRPLRPGARPVDPDPSVVVSPADGRVQQAGRIEGGRMLQAKGMLYSADALLGGHAEAARYRDGAFMTVYLAPHDYHRVHLPLAGTLRAMDYVPGGRWAVNEATAGAVPGLFAANERLTCHFDAPWGSFAVVLVGALNVASISTVWAGEVLPRRPRQGCRWTYDDGAIQPMAKGDELGRFNLGSTVILLLPSGAGRFDQALAPGDRLRVGQRIGALAR